MEETISRMAGSEHGSAKKVSDLAALAASVGRPSRNRTTTYGFVSSERQALARTQDGDLGQQLPDVPLAAPPGGCDSAETPLDLQE